MKSPIMSMALAATILFGSTVTTLTEYEKGKVQDCVYSLSGIVVEVDREQDVVVVMDCTENIWGFYGADDWERGDMASLTMYDSGTPDFIYDDEVLNATYDRLDLLNGIMEVNTNE